MNDSLNTSDIQQFESYLINTGIKITTVKKYVRDIKKLAFFWRNIIRSFLNHLWMRL